MANISAQMSNALDQLEKTTNVDPENVELERTSSVSTFTRHTTKIHAIIKEVIMGLILIVLTIEGIRSSKS